MGAAQRPRPQGGTEARLHLDGLATPILTQVTRQGPTGMTVEQTLPFLRLQTAVWDDADQSSRIESVSVVVLEGIPRLVLDLAYEQDAAVPGEPPTAEPPRAARGIARPRGREATVPFETDAGAPEAPVLASEELPASEPDLGQEAPAIRESTLMFTTPAAREDEPARGFGGDQLTLEERLLLEHSLKYQIAMRWARVEPVLRWTAQRARQLAERAWVVGWPLARAAAAHTARGGAVAARWLRERMRASKPA